MLIIVFISSRNCFHSSSDILSFLIAQCLELKLLLPSLCIPHVKSIKYGGSVHTISLLLQSRSLSTSSIFVLSPHNSRCSPISNRSPSTISVFSPSSTSKSSSSASGSTVSNCTSSHHSSSSSLSHSFARISQSHSQPDTLSLIRNSFSCSSVRLSATMTGISFIHASLQALYLIFPHRIIISLLTTIGRSSNISGKLFTLSTSFLNLSSFMSRGLFGFGLISDSLSVFICLYYTHKRYIASKSKNRTGIKVLYPIGIIIQKTDLFGTIKIVYLYMGYYC